MIFLAVSISITHTKAVIAARKAGARIIAMTDWNVEMFASPAIMKTDYEAAAKSCLQIAKLMSLGSHFRLETPAGCNKIGPASLWR